jgi:hypothetical protein
MKKIFALLIGIMLSITILNSQVAPPQAFSLKATIKSNNGQPVPNRRIRLRISILQNNNNGFAVYSEYFTPTTDLNSQVDIQVGRGTVLSGIFSSIDWSSDAYFLKIEVDIRGGTNYQSLSVTQLLSVPYALYAGAAGSSNNVVTIVGDQTITGIKTFTKDVLISRLTIGRGKGSIISNTAIGGVALSSNTLGIWNTAIGDSALYYNTTGSFNTANGAKALYSNSTGNSNTATGDSALSTNTTGSYNTAYGSNALYYNTLGEGNTAIGLIPLYHNTLGNENTAIGSGALNGNTIGNENTAIGASADVGSENLTNATAIGTSAIVNASNKVVIGNSSVTSIGGYADWTNYSDERLKENIVYKNDLGLNFIKKLQTVSYNFKVDQLKHRRDGLIAQDVAKALKDLGLQFSGIVIDDDKDKTMNLSYGDFVIPLINAVQEQQKQIESQNKQIETQQKQIDELEELVGKLAQK